jgi:hypothetical protein
MERDHRASRSSDDTVLLDVSRHRIASNRCAASHVTAAAFRMTEASAQTGTRAGPVHSCLGVTPATSAFPGALRLEWVGWTKPLARYGGCDRALVSE